MSVTSSSSSKDGSSSSSSYTYGKAVAPHRGRTPFLRKERRERPPIPRPGDIDLRDLIERTKLLQEIDRKTPDITAVRKLIKMAPEQVDCADFFAGTPISIALRREHSKIVDLLINRGGVLLTRSVEEHFPPTLSLKVMAGHPVCISSLKRSLASGTDPLTDFGGDTALETAFRSQSAALSHLFQTPTLIDRWIALRSTQVTLPFLKTLMQCPTDVFLMIIPKLIDQIPKSEQEAFLKLSKTDVSQGVRFRLCRHLMRTERIRQLKSAVAKNPLSMPLKVRKVDKEEFPYLLKVIMQWDEEFETLYDTPISEWTAVARIPASVTSAFISQLRVLLKDQREFLVVKCDEEDPSLVKFEELTLRLLEQKVLNPCFEALDSHPLIFFTKQLVACHHIFFNRVKIMLLPWHNLPPPTTPTEYWVIENKKGVVQGIMRYQAGELVDLVTAPRNLGSGLLRSFEEEKPATGTGIVCIEECLQLTFDDELTSLHLDSTEISADFYTHLGFKKIKCPEDKILFELPSQDFVKFLFNFGGYEGIDF